MWGLHTGRRVNRAIVGHDKIRENVDISEVILYVNYLYSLLGIVRCASSTTAHFTSGFLQPETLCPRRVKCPDNVSLEIPFPYQSVPLGAAVVFIRVIVKYGPKRRGDGRSALSLTGIRNRNFENTSMTYIMYL